MGTSTDAILFYGYCWDEEAEPWHDEDHETDYDEDWSEVVEERLMESSGFDQPNPWDGYPEGVTRAEQETWLASNRVDIDAYRDAKNAALEKASCGVEFGMHCHSECEMPYVFIEDSQTVASRGCPAEIDAVAMVVIGEDWKDNLNLFCERTGINIEGMSPQWWLVSYWG